MSVTHNCASVPFRAMRKILTLSSDGGDNGRKNSKRGNAEAYGGVWWSVNLEGVWNLLPGCRFCVSEFGLSRREDIFTFN
jgi:hypothetical protein